MDMSPIRWLGCLLYFIWQVIALVLTLLAVPFLLPVSLGARIYRYVLANKISRQTGGKVSVVTGEDAIWLQDTPQNPAVINSFMTFKGPLELEKLRDVYLERFARCKGEDGHLLCPNMFNYPSKMYSRFVWIPEEDFDIADHVFIYDGKVPESKKDLEAVISKIASMPFPKKQSPWQFIVIPSKEADGRFYGSFRVHHAMADGVGLVRLLMTKVVDKPPTIRLPKRFASKGSKFLQALMGILKGPHMMIERTFLPGDRSILHGPEPCGEKVVTWSDAMDLAHIKKIKDATKTTVNDVMMSCLAGAYLDYFRQQGAPPPNHVIASVPVDLRPPHAKLDLKNQFTLVYLQLPVFIEDDLERLLETQSRMNVIKSSPEPLVAAMVMKYCMNRLPKWLTRLSFDFFARKASLVLSNVPGPQQKLSLGGHDIEMLVFFPPQRENVGM